MDSLSQKYSRSGNSPFHLGDFSYWASVANVLYDDDKMGTEILAQDPTRKTVRYTEKNGNSIVIKTWMKTRFIPALYKRAYTHTTAFREWYIPERLRLAGIPSVKALAYFHTTMADGTFRQAVVLEDLGRCSHPRVPLKQMLSEQDEPGVEAFENELLAITEKFWLAGFIDTDHRLVNFVVDPRGKLTRIDFEHCRIQNRMFSKLTWRPRAEMLATLLSSYAFAVQPHVHYVTRLGNKLADRLRLSRRLRREIERLVQAAMMRQSTQAGIDTNVRFDW